MVAHWRGTQHTGFNTGVNVGTGRINLYASFLGHKKKRENTTNTREQDPDLELNGSLVLY